jgi:hypothetical protein
MFVAGVASHPAPSPAVAGDLAKIDRTIKKAETRTGVQE